jgi:hypothetical protein
VRIGDKPTPIRKSASMGNLAQLAAEGAGGGGREEGYGSDGERPQKKRGEQPGRVFGEHLSVFLILDLGRKKIGSFFRRFRAYVGVDRHFE